MKKRIAFLLSLIITVLCFGQSIVFADGEYNVVFLGGSITRGTGASSAENSWASLVGDYLKETMTDKTVNCFNAGSGGTGSGYGLRRLKRDVLCHNPDLVFIEFAVNDKSAGRGSIMDSVESILAALRENGNPQVIFVYSTTAKKDAAVDTYEEIAQHYGIFSINVQDYLFGLEEAGEITVNDLLTDGTHPNDAGYKMYADYIISCLKEENAFTLPQNNGVIEGNIDTNLYSYIYASEAEYTNRWETIPNNGSGPIESYLLGMNKG
ncbi:MAG: SGNH/GDSL hydrolase family protein, partial [Clostridia bacterium]|nr:SGNH/GDSL hydrolase family protein [Clostridia bacterium]